MKFIIQQIEKAIVIFSNKTCIKFAPRTKVDFDYILIQRNATGCRCWAGVHCFGGEQNLNLQICL